MKARTYIGSGSGKLHLEVGGVTLATEGDLCRDAELRITFNSNVWHRGMLTHVENVLNFALKREAEGA